MQQHAGYTHSDLFIRKRQGRPLIGRDDKSKLLFHTSPHTVSTRFYSIRRHCRLVTVEQDLTNKGNTGVRRIVLTAAWAYLDNIS